MRYVYVFATTSATSSSSQHLAGAVPFQLSVLLDAQMRLGDAGGRPDDSGDFATRVAKAEVDFGDGLGWQDLTVDAHDLWWQQPNGGPVYDPAWMTHYTYSQPGEYRIRGRITYWDGELIYAAPQWEVTVTVTEPVAP